MHRIFTSYQRPLLHFVRPHWECLKKTVTKRMLLESKNPDWNGVLWGIRIHFNVSVMLFRVLHNEIGRTSNSFITHMTLEYHKVNANTFLFSLNLRAPILKCQCWSNFHILEFFCISRKTVGVEFSSYWVEVRKILSSEVMKSRPLLCSEMGYKNINESPF